MVPLHAKAFNTHDAFSLGATQLDYWQSSGLIKEEWLDRLLIASVIEARSHERFDAVIPQLDATLSSFYAKLAEAERHAALYYDLAQQKFSDELVDLRLNEIAVEAKQIDQSEGISDSFVSISLCFLVLRRLYSC